MRLLPVPRGPDGPDREVMAQWLAENRPKIYGTVPVLHNPTCYTLSLAAAHQILKLAEQFDLTLVEDDTCAWLAPPHAPRLAALDGLTRTLYGLQERAVAWCWWRPAACSTPHHGPPP